MLDILATIAWGIWSVLGQMSPYLLFGFLVAGVLSVCISPEFVERHLGGRGFAPVVKATMLGVPLPLCSCGVIPVGASFRRHGASRAAVTSFLISTPETGVDSILVTYALLGATFAVYRPVVALAAGLLGGLLVMLFVQSGRNDDHKATDSSGEKCTERTGESITVGIIGHPERSEGSPCVKTSSFAALRMTVIDSPIQSCCAGEGLSNPIWRAMQYAFITLPRDIGRPLLVGVAIAGAITAVVPADSWQPYLGGGLPSIVLLMALGIPIYVCASASVPLALGLMHLGASPGAALAFLIAGPASNAATITTTWKLLGPRTVFLYLLTIAFSAIVGGLSLDWLTDRWPALLSSMPLAGAHAHGAEAGGWTSAFWAVLLLLVFAFAHAAKYLPERLFFTKPKAAGGLPSGGEQVILTVGGMTCDHCAATVTQALIRCPGVTLASVDRAKGRAVVGGENLQLDKLAAAVEKAGYTAEVEKGIK